MKLPVKKTLFLITTILGLSTPVLGREYVDDEMMRLFFNSPRHDSSTANVSREIEQLIAANAQCTAVCIGNRGCFNSNGNAFLRGMVNTMVRSSCRSASDPILSQMVNGDNTSNRDALAPYFTGDRSERNMLVTTKLLTLSLGMWETSGRYWEGVDVTNSGSLSRAVSAEAGLFQTSYDVRGGGQSEWAQALAQLEEQYRNNPELCMTEAFTPEGGSGRRRQGIGSGVGRDFQELMRNCPALAAEHAMITVRHNRRHYGPLNRREARPVEACRPLFNALYDRAQQNAAYCTAFGVESPENPLAEPTQQTAAAN